MEITIQKTVDLFIQNISLSRSENTERTYRNAMNAFLQMLSESGIDPDASVDLLSEKVFSSYAKYLKAYSPSTESLYINVAKNYFEFLAAEEIRNFNLSQKHLRFPDSFLFYMCIHRFLQHTIFSHQDMC